MAERHRNRRQPEQQLREQQEQDGDITEARVAADAGIEQAAVSQEADADEAEEARDAAITIAINCLKVCDANAGPRSA
jgi:hypothetical protein